MDSRKRLQGESVIDVHSPDVIEVEKPSSHSKWNLSRDDARRLRRDRKKCKKEKKCKKKKRKGGITSIPILTLATTLTNANSSLTKHIPINNVNFHCFPVSPATPLSTLKKKMKMNHRLRTSVTCNCVPTISRDLFMCTETSKSFSKHFLLSRNTLVNSWWPQPSPSPAQSSSKSIALYSKLSMPQFPWVWIVSA